MPPPGPTDLLPAPPEERIHHSRSPHQEIEVFRDATGKLTLVLDGFVQFESPDEYVFHEALVDPAMVLAPSPRRVLILGGGDGLAARNVLRYGEVERVVLCELDADVVALARTLPDWAELTAGALTDPRLEVVIDDALRFVRRPPEAFDVIVCDFPAPTHRALDPLFSPAFFASLRPWAAPGAVVSVQVSAPPTVFWPVLDAVSESFPAARGQLASMTDGTLASFVLAAESADRPVRAFPTQVRWITAARMKHMTLLQRSSPHFVTSQGTFDVDPM